MRRMVIPLLVMLVLGIVMAASPAAASPAAAADSWGRIEITPATAEPGQQLEVVVVCELGGQGYKLTSDGFVEQEIELVNNRGTATAVSAPGTYYAHAWC